MMLQEAAATPARYLFSVPTIDLLDEHAKRFRAICPTAQCQTIHSQSGAKDSVGRRITKLPQTYLAGCHVAAFVTHEAMMDATFEEFAGWHARIDETPDAVKAGTLRLGQGVAGFKAEFELTSVDETNWSQLRLRDGKNSWKQSVGDSLWSNLSDFRRLSCRPEGVLVDMNSWAQAQTGGEVKWFSVWTPISLRAFDSVTIAGAGLLSSVAYKVISSTYKTLTFNIRDLNAARLGQPHITIFYFTRGHTGSTTFWEKSEGRRCLVAIERWLAGHYPDVGFWSGNEVVCKSLEHRIPGKMTKPKLAGLNNHRAATSCAFFYSSKCLPDDVALRDIFQLTDADIHSAREGEDVFQFVSRGAIRDRAYDGPFEIFLYSHDQAEHLKARLLSSGFRQVEIRALTDAGILDVKRASGRNAASVSASDSEQRASEKKAANARRNRELRARKRKAKTQDE